LVALRLVALRFVAFFFLVAMITPV